MPLPQRKILSVSITPILLIGVHLSILAQVIKRNLCHLFLIDGLGALLSAFLLGYVLVQWEPVFGIPRRALYVLAVIPCFFAVFDFLCYRHCSDKRARYLKIIALLNVGYCCLSLCLAATHQATVTVWGWVYIGGECAVVLALAFVEWRTAVRW